MLLWGVSSAPDAGVVWHEMLVWSPWANQAGEQDRIFCVETVQDCLV